MPHFSVIIPVYNRLELLKEALQSALAQDLRDYEIIVVDDGSTDGTWEYLETLPGEIRRFRQPNAGPGAARNLGAAHARGSHLAFLDSDDLWYPWSLRAYYLALQQRPGCSVVAGRFLPFVGSPSLAPTADVAQLALEYYSCFLEAAAQGLYAGAGMIVVRREAFLQAGGFCSAIQNAEDHDLLLRLGDISGFAVITHPYTLRRRNHVGSISSVSSRIHEGVRYLVDSEKAGRYPGGVPLSQARRFIIAQHARSAATSLARAGHRRQAWSLYLSTLRWQVGLGRLKFVFGTPILILASLLKR